VAHTGKKTRSFTVQFTTDDGTSGALAKVAADQIRPHARNEIHHARPFALAAH
jgi:hypothetical protein